MTLPLAELAETARRKVRRPLFATLCGHHLRGTASSDSPWVVVGAMLLPLREVLGLRPAADTKERRVAAAGREALLSFHDLRRSLDLLARAANTAALEDLHSPHVVLTGPEHDHLKRLSRTLLTRTCFHDFRDRAEVHRRRLGSGIPHALDFVEAARLYMCGAHALETGAMMSDVESLAEHRAQPFLRSFVARIREDGELARLSEDELRLLERELDRLAGALADAHARSRLPEGVGSISSLDEFLVDLRLKDLQSPP